MIQFIWMTPCFINWATALYLLVRDRLLTLIVCKTSTLKLSSNDGTKVATLKVNYSSHNWDIKEYDKPDFTLYCFNNHFTLEWQMDEAKSTNNNTTTTTITTATETTTEDKPNPESKSGEKPNVVPLITGSLDGTFMFFWSG